MKKTKVLGIDFETQGIDAKKTNVTEVGAILVEVTESEDSLGSTREEIARLSSFVYDNSYPPQSKMIIDLTGITDADLKSPGSLLPKDMVDCVINLIDQADIIMAHNVSFDRSVFEEQFLRAMGADCPSKKWLCSLRDIQYPSRFTCKKLGHLALDHGVKMDHRKLHRAADDVELMLDLVLGNYNIFDLVAYHDVPKVTIKIDIPKPWHDGGAGKTVAMDNGYVWNQEKSAWLKTVPSTAVEKERSSVQFRVSVLV